MILGYGIIAVPTGIVTSEMTKPNNINNTEVCQNCGEDSHIDKSKFCRNCGHSLET
jgi:voltage-gated potassium channel